MAVEIDVGSSLQAQKHAVNNRPNETTLTAPGSLVSGMAGCTGTEVAMLGWSLGSLMSWWIASIDNYMLAHRSERVWTISLPVDDNVTGRSLLSPTLLPHVNIAPLPRNIRRFLLLVYNSSRLLCFQLICRIVHYFHFCIPFQVLRRGRRSCTEGHPRAKITFK